MHDCRLWRGRRRWHGSAGRHRRGARPLRSLRMSVEPLLTERLRLTPLVPALHGEAVHGLYDDPRFSAHLASGPIRSAQAMAAYLAEFDALPPGQGGWVAVQRGDLTGRVIGRFSLRRWRHGVPGDPLEVGWFLAVDCWGRGLAAEGIGAVLSYAGRLGHSRVLAIVRHDNARSRALAERLGGTVTGQGQWYGEEASLRYELPVPVPVPAPWAVPLAVPMAVRVPARSGGAGLGERSPGCRVGGSTYGGAMSETTSDSTPDTTSDTADTSSTAASDSSDSPSAPSASTAGAGETIGATTEAPDGLQKDPSQWVSGDDPITESQKSYLDTLARRAGEELPAQMSKAEASEHIDRLRGQLGME